MARVPTISEIKAKTLKTNPYFFSRDTMRFFGQRMSSFRVRRSPKGNIFIYAPGQKSAGAGYTFRQYKNGELNLPDRLPHILTLSRVLDYIKKH